VKTDGKVAPKAGVKAHAKAKGKAVHVKKSKKHFAKKHSAKKHFTKKHTAKPTRV